MRFSHTWFQPEPRDPGSTNLTPNDEHSDTRLEFFFFFFIIFDVFKCIVFIFVIFYLVVFSYRMKCHLMMDIVKSEIYYDTNEHV